MAPTRKQGSFNKNKKCQNTFLPVLNGIKKAKKGCSLTTSELPPFRHNKPPLYKIVPSSSNSKKRDPNIVNTKHLSPLPNYPSPVSD